MISLETSRSRPYSTFLLLCVFVFLFCAPWFYGLTRFKDQLVAQLVISGLFLLLLPTIDFKKMSSWRFHGIDRWIFGIGCFAFVYVLISVVPSQSLITFQRWLAGIFLYILVRNVVTSRNTLISFLWVTAVAGALYSIYGLLQYYDILPHSFWYQAQSLSSRFVNGGHFAVFLLFALFPAISLLIFHKNWASRLFLLALCSPMVWAMILSRSRTTWIAFALGFFFFLFCLVRYRILGARAFWGFIALALLGTVLCAFYWKGWDLIWARFHELSRPDVQFYNLTYRVNLWKGSLLAIASRPWGWGLGTFQFIFPMYRMNVDRFLVYYAHNDVIQSGVDFGLPGIAFLVGFLFFYFRGAFSFLKSENIASRDKTIGIGFLTLAVSLILASQLDFALRIYAVTTFLVVFLALSSYLFQDSHDGLKTFLLPFTRWAFPLRPIYCRAATFVLVLLMQVLTAKHLLAEISFERGTRDEHNFAWVQAEKEFEKAVRWVPYDVRYRKVLGELYQKKMGLSLNRRDRENFRSKAIEVFEKALKLQPYASDFYYWLGFLYEGDGQIDRAKSEFARARDLEPLNALFISEFGFFAIRHGLKKEAVRAFETFLKIPYRNEGAFVDPCALIKKIYQVTQDYNDLRRVMPNTWEVHRCLGILLGEKGRWDLAKQELFLALKVAEQAAGTIGDYFEAVIRGPIAKFFLEHGKNEEAIEIYKKAIDANPRDLLARQAIQQIYKQIGLSPSTNLPS